MLTKLPANTSMKIFGSQDANIVSALEKFISV